MLKLNKVNHQQAIDLSLHIEGVLLLVKDKDNLFISLLRGYGGGYYFNDHKSKVAYLLNDHPDLEIYHIVETTGQDTLT